MEKITVSGLLEMNCYVIEHNKKCFIVDPGYQKEKIVEYINNKGYSVEGILLTHGHLDHISAIDCFDVPVYVYEKEIALVKDDSLNGFNELNVQNPLNLNNINFKIFNDEYQIKLGDKKIVVIPTPGHTAGGVCYMFGYDVYTGDTIFKGSVGRHDFATGDSEALKYSVVNLLDSLDDNYKLHPGHGESTTVGEEKQNNMFYKMWKKEVK